MLLSTASGASSAPGDLSAAEDLEFRRWNLARRLCLAVRAADRPDDAAAAASLARLGRILRDGAADPARRKLKSGSASFVAKLWTIFRMVQQAAPPRYPDIYILTNPFK